MGGDGSQAFPAYTWHHLPVTVGHGHLHMASSHCCCHQVASAVSWARPAPLCLNDAESTEVGGISSSAVG